MIDNHISSNWLLTILLGVVAATINVLCELVRREPRDYLSLAPQLFRLMTTSSNNWMLIKLIKLVGDKCLNVAGIYSPIVWFPFPTRAASGEEAPASHYGTHLHNTSYLSFV